MWAPGHGGRRTPPSAPAAPARSYPRAPGKACSAPAAGYILRSSWGEDAACRNQQGCGQCPLCDLFGSTARRGRIGFRDSTVTQPRVEGRSHVAIDRISGGGRDKLLFTDDVVTAGRVSLTITPLGQVEEWERNLLLHVVADIHDGLIGVGGGVQRGQGTLQLTDASRSILTALQPMPSRPPVAEEAP